MRRVPVATIEDAYGFVVLGWKVAEEANEALLVVDLRCSAPRFNNENNMYTFNSGREDMITVLSLRMGSSTGGFVEGWKVRARGVEVAGDALERVARSHCPALGLA